MTRPQPQGCPVALLAARTLQAEQAKIQALDRRAGVECSSPALRASWAAEAGQARSAAKGSAHGPKGIWRLDRSAEPGAGDFARLTAMATTEALNCVSDSQRGGRHPSGA